MKKGVETTPRLVSCLLYPFLVIGISSLHKYNHDNPGRCVSPALTPLHLGCWAVMSFLPYFHIHSTGLPVGLGQITDE